MCTITLIWAVLSFGCAQNPERDAQAASDKDPWEGMNRGVFAFNDRLDAWVLKPTAKGYKAIAPQPVEVGVSNFFANLAEVSNVVNNILQWKWGKAGNDSGRFLMNSTVGVVGLFDVAQHVGLERNDRETFGQTLTVWGLGAGPYLVLPFLGPSTTTDTAAMPVGWFLDPTSYIDDNRMWLLKAMEVVDARASLLETEDLVSGDKYVFIREAYLQRREFLVKDGDIQDDFGGDFGDFEDFEGDF